MLELGVKWENLCRTTQTTPKSKASTPFRAACLAGGLHLGSAKRWLTLITGDSFVRELKSKLNTPKPMMSSPRFRNSSSMFTEAVCREAARSHVASPSPGRSGYWRGPPCLEMLLSTGQVAQTGCLVIRQTPAAPVRGRQLYNAHVLPQPLSLFAASTDAVCNSQCFSNVSCSMPLEKLPGSRTSLVHARQRCYTATQHIPCTVQPQPP